MKPILFNAEMVKAILEGRKTSTRRIIKEYVPEDVKWGYIFFTPKHHVSFRGTFDGQYGEKFYKPPYWIGDILYVRETWQEWTDDLCTCYECHGCNHKDYIYKAGYGEDEEIKWKPSIHMPKVAARIFLRVTGVRVQRIQDITEGEAQKEGVTEKVCYDNYSQKFFNRLGGKYKYGFGKLWNSCGYKWPNSWSANPWVWVFEFERVEKE